MWVGMVFASVMAIIIPVTLAATPVHDLVYLTLESGHIIYVLDKTFALGV
jgi:hypothetical protein